MVHFVFRSLIYFIQQSHTVRSRQLVAGTQLAHSWHTADTQL